MSARPALEGRGLVASALAAAAGWLLEPAEPTGPDRPQASVDARPVIAVVGLAARCGATTVARAVAAQLAARDPGGASVVTWLGPAGAVPLGLPAAGRLARTLSPLAVGSARACGRLCLVEGADPAALAGAARYLAPLVLDVEDRSVASATAALADHVLLVGSPGTEPALAALLAESLGRVGPEPVAVLNRAGRDCERWAGRCAAEIPDSRIGARLALAGREPRGGLGEAIGGLVERCGEAR